MAAPLPAQGAPDLTNDEQVLHVLNRLAYGPRPGDAARVRAMGVDTWIERQLAPATIPDTAVTRLLARYEMLDADQGEIMALYREQVAMRRSAGRAGADSTRSRVRQQGNPRLRRGVTDVEGAKLLRAVASERQLEELMADFWANHFSIFKGKGQTRLFVAQYDRDVVRPHAMGKFRDLLGAVAKSPAMLFYLDNARSVAEREGMAGRQRGLNENYARELLELHTLGVDGGYTQADVREVARAFTGWTIEQRTGEFIFRPRQHDREAKRVLGTAIRRGGGIEDGERVLDLLARHPATARHVARKLVVRFVSDSPPPALVERAAATFTRTGGDIRETLRTIVTSDEFFSREAWRAKVKTPFELVASTYRALGALPDESPRAPALVARLGQPIYGRQTPDGWPDTADEWMNAGAILARINFGLLAAGGRLPGARVQEWPGMQRLRSEPRERQVDIVVGELLGGSVSRETREILVNGSNPLAGRTPAMADDSLAASARTLRLGPVQQLVGLALGTPEFQRR